MYAVTFALLSPSRIRISKVSLSDYKNTLRTEFFIEKKIVRDLISSFTIMHLFFYFRLLAFWLLKGANKITDGNPLKAILGSFVEQQGATMLRVFGKGARIMKV